MKKIYYAVRIFFIPALLLVATQLEGRGGMGGGGGRGGGGGGARAAGGRAQSVNRSPSMSRVSATRPSNVSRPVQTRPQAARPAASPSAPQRQAGFQQQRISGQTATRNDVQQFLNQNTSPRPSQMPARAPGQNRGLQPGDKSVQRPGGQLATDRTNLGNNIRGQIGQNRPDRGNWFNDQFWNDHGVRPPYYNQGMQGNWWKLATAAGVSNWLRWDDYNPVYYDYYPYDNYWGVSESDGSSGSEPAAATPDYSQQAAGQQESSSAQGDNQEWMPLGVFALSKETGTEVTPNIYMQLALNRDGQISGTYYNTTMDAAYELEGVADKSTKRAAWKVVGNDNAPILETGIYNLTQNELPVRVNFADGRSQQFIMIRLNPSS